MQAGNSIMEPESRKMADALVRIRIFILLSREYSMVVGRGNARRGWEVTNPRRMSADAY